MNAVLFFRHFLHLRYGEKLVATGEIPWEKVGSEVIRYGLAGYFYQNIEQLQADRLIPADVAEGWKVASRGIALKNMYLEQAAETLIVKLKDVGIHPILLKGPVHTETIYGNRDVRPFSDIDLLIRQEEFPATKQVLFDEGFDFYELPVAEDQAGQAADREVNFDELHFVKQGTQLSINVDIHWRLEGMWEESPLKKLYPLDDIPWRSKTDKIRLGRCEVECLNFELHALHLVTHFSLHHVFVGPRWFLDLCLLFGNHSDRLDWDKLRLYARGELRTALGIVLRLVAEVAGKMESTPDWREFWHNGNANWKYELFRRNLFAGDNKKNRYLCTLLLPSRWQDSANYLSWLLFSPQALPEARGDESGFRIFQPLYLGYLLFGGKRRKMK